MAYTLPGSAWDVLGIKDHRRTGRSAHWLTRTGQLGRSLTAGVQLSAVVHGPGAFLPTDLNRWRSWLIQSMIATRSRRIRCYRDMGSSLSRDGAAARCSFMWAQRAPMLAEVPMHSVADLTDRHRSDPAMTAASKPPIGPYRRAPVEVYQADPHAPEVARRLIELIATRWPGTPAEHVGSSAVPELPGKGIIDLLLPAEPADVPAVTQALLELGFQPQIPAVFQASRPMLWGPSVTDQPTTGSTGTWCRPPAPRSPPCAASATPCAPTRSCGAGTRPSSEPSWPAGRLTRWCSATPSTTGSLPPSTSSA